MRMKLLNRLLIYIIKFYQITISPFLGYNCRYNPTCSSYFITCYNKYNTIYASYLGIKRVLSCHPLGGSGYDPVP